MEYQAASPDEIAIVKWTETIGVTLMHRDIQTMRLGFGDRIIEFTILYVFPFTSTTKRMGIILRSTAGIYFYEKGADVVMRDIVQYNEWLDEECGNMARDGLRTLVIARKKLSEETFTNFEKSYNMAKASMSGRTRATEDCVDRYLESGMELLGITGVEDRLQDGVKNTIEMLRNAGIKIWLLTGDKVETAACILSKWYEVTC